MAIVWVFTQANAQSLKQFTFKSRLAEANEHFTGNKKISFTVYKVNDVIWTETHEQVAVKDGYYEVVLGSKKPFPASLFFVDKWPAARIEKEGLSPFNLDAKVSSMLEMRSYQDWGYGSLEQLRTRIAALEAEKIQLYQDVAIDQNLIIKVDDVTEGIYTLSNTVRNNDIISAIPLSIPLAKFGKQIDFDKISLKTSSRDYTKFFINFVKKEELDEDDESIWYYIWQQQLAEMAGVSPKEENEDLIIAKINAYLNKSVFNYMYGFPSMLSQNNGASVMNAAVQRLDWSFLDDVLKYLRFPLNQVVTYVNGIARTAGPATFLDQVYEDILLYSNRELGSDSFDKLMEYYVKFRDRGARHYKYPEVGPRMTAYIKAYKEFFVQPSKNINTSAVIKPYLYAKVDPATKKSGFIASDTVMDQFDMMKVKNPVWQLPPTFNTKYFAEFDNNDYAVITEEGSGGNQTMKVIDRTGKLVFTGAEGQKIWICQGVPFICVMDLSGKGLSEICNFVYFYNLKTGKRVADLPKNDKFIDNPPHIWLEFHKTIARFSKDQLNYCYSSGSKLSIKTNARFVEQLNKAFANGNFYTLYVYKEKGGLEKVLDKSIGYLMGRDGSFKIIKEDWIDQYKIPFEDWNAITQKILQIKQP
jgi:hypothetical protein